MNKNSLFVAIFILSFVSFSIVVSAYTIQDFTTWLQNLFSPKPLYECLTCADDSECASGYCQPNGCCAPSGGGGCTPSCSGVPCGSSDGCNGICQSGSGCIQQCIPNCAGKSCGADDGCGSPCTSGYCSNGGQCINGQCLTQLQDCTQLGGVCKSSCLASETDISNTYQCGIGGHCCQANTPSCTNECATEGQKICTSALSYEACQKGLDGCLHWVSNSCPSSTPYCSNGACTSTSTSTSSCIQGGSPTTQSYCKDSYGGTQTSQCSGSDQLIYYHCNSAATACISDPIYCTSQCGNSGALCINGACVCNTGACTTSNQATTCASYTSPDKCKVGTCSNGQCQSQSVADGTICQTSSGSGTCQSGTCITNPTCQPPYYSSNDCGGKCGNTLACLRSNAYPNCYTCLPCENAGSYYSSGDCNGNCGTLDCIKSNAFPNCYFCAVSSSTSTSQTAPAPSSCSSTEQGSTQCSGDYLLTCNGQQWIPSKCTYGCSNAQCNPSSTTSATTSPTSTGCSTNGDNPNYWCQNSCSPQGYEYTYYSCSGDHWQCSHSFTNGNNPTFKCAKSQSTTTTTVTASAGIIQITYSVPSTQKLSFLIGDSIQGKIQIDDNQNTFIASVISSGIAKLITFNWNGDTFLGTTVTTVVIK